MTDTAGDKPFPGFPGFPPAEMLDKMWDMMRLTPFGSAFPGMQPGSAQGFGSPLTAMSDMMSPLMSVEDLDKRITDMRAVEQWLKLNVNMLSSAIQALEVQRATLATLRAFGAFADASMSQAPKAEAARPASSGWTTSSSGAASKPEGETRASGDDAQREQASHDASAAGQPAFDPSAWWNLLQSQFNQLASFAVSQPGAGAAAAGNAAADAKPEGAKPAAKRAATAKRPAAPKRGGTAPRPTPTSSNEK
ncbi:transcriptional regulator [Trinickia sp. LjRoot230]|uniref:PhaM family polyhydroxyalkanoate granule multifunctional regulatory protein n=1 Tax=Trinickia sp. LjRoot230 TaxID=3342288 RepID=UPI003ECD2E4B